MTVYNQFPPSSTTVNTGVSENVDIIIGNIQKIILTKEDYSIADIDTAKLASTYATGIVARDVLPLPLIEEFVDNSEDDVYSVSPATQIARFIREGKTDMTFTLKFEPGLYSRLRALNGQLLRLITVDDKNQVIGTTTDGTTFAGIKAATLRVEKWKQSTGDNISTFTIRFVAESNYERNDTVKAFCVDWDIKDLNGIQPALLTSVSSSATTLVVDLAMADDGVAIEGADEVANFIFLESDGTTEVTITGVTESATIPGRYTLTATAFTTLGALNLRDVVTVSGSYYAGTAITITIV